MKATPRAAALGRPSRFGFPACVSRNTHLALSLMAFAFVTSGCATAKPSPPAREVLAAGTERTSDVSAMGDPKPGGAIVRDRRAMLRDLEEELVAKHGEAHRAAIARGLEQVDALWLDADGDLWAFATANFIPDEGERRKTLERLEAALEQIDGHMNEIALDVRIPIDLDVGPLLAVDTQLATFEPGAHVIEDLFKAKVAFTVLLNFPLTTLAERLESGAGWSRERWAAARLAARFGRRAPAEVQQRITRELASSDLYISGYNIWMHHVVDADGGRLFPKGMRLISHWNLRDEIKSLYADPTALPKQRAVIQVMERIVTQSIPAAVVDDPLVDWDPFSNAIARAPAAEIELDAPKEAVARAALSGREPDRRYEHWLSNFHAMRAMDRYVPAAPNSIARTFEVGRELPEARVVAMLKQVLESPMVPKVAAEIAKRLGRPLEPQDLWYAGFLGKGQIPQAELDALTKRRYPNAAAFAADLPRILRELGFPKERADYIAARIQVDSSRGAGHAAPAARRGSFPRLRTRIGQEGMDYKGYNIAIHELGHNVEQVLSLYAVDRTLLASVPNNAMTEACAFLFQARDLQLLGLKEPSAAQAERDRVLASFWQTFEIAGVALVELAAWHWLYDHPTATPAELRDAVVRLGRETWNRYYAPHLGTKDLSILGIYSHLVAYPLYVADYPIGQLVAFQLEEHMKGVEAMGVEFERIVSQGLVSPDLWMERATGKPIGPDALLRATQRVLSGGAVPESRDGKAGKRR